MRQVTRYGRSEEFDHPVPFPVYFRSWINDQRHHLQELVAISRQHRDPASNMWAPIVDDGFLLRLIEGLTLKYELYYRTKSAWVGGWRPALAIEILYSKSSIQMEAGMGLTTGDQRLRLEAMQREEDGIMDNLAAIHDSMGDASMVELVHNVSEMMREGVAVDQRLVNVHLSHNEARQLRDLQMADDLRMRTLKKVVDVLSPIQCVHFMIGLTELQLRIHEWGQSRDTIDQARDIFDGSGGRAPEA